MAETELLPCPCCAATNPFWCVLSNIVLCPNCGLQTKTTRKDIAFGDWNRRATDPAVAELVEASRQVQSLIAVTIGEGPEATIPEIVPTRLGIPVRAGDIMRDFVSALAKHAAKP